jgi:predicted Zn-dependent peptidase
MHARRVAQLKDAAERPTSIASKVMNRLAWGDNYDGRYATEASYDAMNTQRMAAFHKDYVVPRHATLMVGGDLTLEEIVPLLEARLASWKPQGEDLPAIQPIPLATPETATVFLVDKPGAAQSVLRTLLPVGTRVDDDYYDFFMGNTAVGGAFTARLNMNLREDKGYTYGARCGLAHGLGPSLWTCSASVATDVTKPSMTELVKEIGEALSTRPVTEDELAFFRSYRVNSFESSYETASALLGSLGDIWTYDLPASWLESYVPSIDEVTVERIQIALADHIDPDHISYIVVGDAEVIAQGLAELGMPVVRLDRDGNQTESP